MVHTIRKFQKINKSMRTGSGAADIYKPKLHWFLYADSFLRKNIEINMKTESNLMSLFNNLKYIYIYIYEYYYVEYCYLEFG